MLSMLILLLLQGNFTALRLGAQGSFPKPLSAQEERRCLELAAAGDQAARGKLIEHNLRLVAHIVKKYYTQIGGDTDDLISIGTLGLIKAVNTYNMEKKSSWPPMPPDALKTRYSCTCARPVDWQGRYP